mmetsp:Transcript_25564/g.38025  ORF Transcript_25564/g.38025 Transcript_25564/m.38025 type:complete len:105 (+) Transcript_25564:757-1071(+)
MRENGSDGFLVRAATDCDNVLEAQLLEKLKDALAAPNDPRPKEAPPMFGTNPFLGVILSPANVAFRLAERLPIDRPESPPPALSCWKPFGTCSLPLTNAGTWLC